MRTKFKKGDQVRLTKAARREFKGMWDPRHLKVGTVLTGSPHGRRASYVTVRWGRDLVEAMAENLLELA